MENLQGKFTDLLQVSTRKLDLYLMGTGGIAGVFELVAKNHEAMVIWLISILFPATLRLWKFIVDLRRSRQLHRIAVKKAKLELKYESDKYDIDPEDIEPTKK